MAAVDIALMGATYSDVPGVTLPQDGGGTATFYEISDTTAQQADVASGKYFYSASGVRTAGTGTGGGGITGTAVEVSIATTDWSNHFCTKTVSGVTADNIVFVSPDPTSYNQYITAGVYCEGQAADTLSFRCDTDPSMNITVNVLILDGVTVVEPTLYQITNGFTDVTIAAEAAEGESVTATYTGRNQVRMFIYQSGTAIAQNDDFISAGGTLTFTMPAADVSVDVVIKPR